MIEAASSASARAATLACKPTAVRKLSRAEFVAFLHRRPDADAGVKWMLVDRLSVS